MLSNWIRWLDCKLGWHEVAYHRFSGFLCRWCGRHLEMPRPRKGRR